MSQINRTGTFRFQATDAGIKAKKKGEKDSNVVQWIAQLKAVEYYDEETEQWIDWSEYDECEITAYLTLFGKEKQAIFHVHQLQKALGWSGADFSEIETEHIADVIFQGRVEEHTYEGVTSLRIAQVDAYDAEPGRILQKLDADEVKKLNAKFASQLRELSGGIKPQSVPKPKVDKEEAKAAKREQLAGQRARGKAAEAKAPQPKSRPVPPRSPAKNKTASEEQEKIDKGSAWADCCAGRDKSVSDKDLENAWHRVVDELDGEDVVEKKSLWADVRDKVITQVKIPI